MSVVRLIWAGWKFHVKSLTLSGFFLLTSVLQPIIFASVAYFMFEAGARPGTLLYVALGAGMMGIWSSTLFGSGGAIQWQRWQGTLEYCIAVPPPFLLVIVPLTLATATIGLYSLTATLFWGWLFFDVPLEVAHPAAFVVALPVTVIGLGLLGLVLASTFILYRNANALSNLLEYPVWLVTGLLVSLSLLPGWVAPISWLLAPTWGINALRESAISGNAWPEIGMCLLLAGVYLVIGYFLAAALRAAGAGAGDPLADVTNLRIFFIGGYISYRALFNWMHPSMYIPTMLGAPIFQILFFAYIGRFAQVENDEFFVVGNAVQLSAMAGVYGMAMTIGGERWTQTLSQLLATPANRLPLFLGRALPLIANGIITSVFAFAVGWLLLDVHMPRARSRRW